ncbi:hypothetical protein FPV67DRAFT_871334 [Lyophyllum atratum]|nr:hypothetical protein FPV67DRAFT_871334 [Lyophyllum atratum]
MSSIGVTIPIDPPPTSSPPTSPPSSQPTTTPPSSSPPTSPGSSDPTSLPPSSPPPSSATSLSSTSQLPSSTSLLPTPSTSVIASTSVGVSNGQTFTTVVLSTTIQVPGTINTAPPGQPKSSTNIGAIVGGVVGGVGGALALLALLLLLIRRHKRRQEKSYFDGNFDPAHVVPATAPRISLPDDDEDQDDGMGGRLGTGVGGVVSPFSYVPESEMRQNQGQGQIPGALVAGGAGVGAGAYAHQGYAGHPGYQGQGPYAPTTQTHSDAGTASTGSAYYTLPPQQQAAYPNLNVYPGPGVIARGPGSVSSHGGSNTHTQTSASRSAKEREAFAGRNPPGGLGVANPDTEGAGASGVDEGRRQAYLRSGPVVHQDGGRVEEEGEGEEAGEIPPTYDSLPEGDRR